MGAAMRIPCATVGTQYPRNIRANSGQHRTFAARTVTMYQTMNRQTTPRSAIDALPRRKNTSEDFPAGQNEGLDQRSTNLGTCPRLLNNGHIHMIRIHFHPDQRIAQHNRAHSPDSWVKRKNSRDELILFQILVLSETMPLNSWTDTRRSST